MLEYPVNTALLAVAGLTIRYCLTTLFSQLQFLYVCHCCLSLSELHKYWHTSIITSLGELGWPLNQLRTSSNGVMLMIKFFSHQFEFFACMKHTLFNLKNCVLFWPLVLCWWVWVGCLQPLTSLTFTSMIFVVCPYCSSEMMMTCIEKTFTCKEERDALRECMRILQNFSNYLPTKSVTVPTSSTSYKQQQYTKGKGYFT